MMKLTRPTTLAVVAALSLVAAGCGTHASEVDKATKLAEKQLKNPPPVTDIKQPVIKAEKVAPGPGEGDLAKKPVIPKQTATPPSELKVQDLIVGNGAEATTGSQVSVQYVGQLYDTGKEFDSSWKRNKPFDFALGGGQVIPGWDQGVAGMKVGGQRTLVIPASMGYGARGAGGAIPPNATLVFDVELLGVH